MPAPILRHGVRTLQDCQGQTPNVISSSAEDQTDKASDEYFLFPVLAGEPRKWILVVVAQCPIDGIVAARCAEDRIPSVSLLKDYSTRLLTSEITCHSV